MPSAAIHRPALGLVAIVIAVAACNTASAQRYGQNPGVTGVFVPLADGPIPEGTTGTSVSSNSSATTSTSAGAFTLGNGMQFSLQNGQLSFNVDADVNPGFFSLVSSFGNIDFTFQTMLGTQVHIVSNVNNDLATVNITFGSRFFNTGDGSGSNEPGLPDANPVDDANSGVDGSPGNPLGST